MAPITIATHISDIVPLALQAYLSTTTGITNWQDFDSGAGILSTSEVSYQGTIWVNRFSPSTEKALRMQTTFESAYSIRLIISANNIDLVSLLSHKWARTLSRMLESVATLEGQRREGGTLDGTYEGLTLTNATLDLAQGDWSITVEENKDGGGRGVIVCPLTLRSL